MKILSVNEILENLEVYEGKDVYLQGALVFEFEDVSVCHMPRSERKSEYYGNSIWISCSPLLQFNDLAMQKMAHKPVLIEGKIMAPNPQLGGCGHLSAWPAEIVATDIGLYK